MKSFNRKRYALSVAIAAALLPLGVQAQSNDAAAQDTPAQPATGQSATTLDTVVVTGAASGGVKKLEASYNIVTASEAQIKQANPKSTADLLKISPGLWPESSGGQTGANIEIAGFPGGGDAPFFSALLMGSPMYGMNSMSFFETSSLLRLDDTISGVEILQGGPSVVYADGQIGATANFFLKTGTDTPSGSVGVTYGDEGLYRVDVFTGFPVGKSGWVGSLGGFYRESNGVRDPEFPADKGGQITGTLAKDFDGGNVTFYARYINDKNQFITPIPLIQTGEKSFREYPGFDAQTDTYYSKAIQKVYLPGYPGGGTNADLANGRGTKFFFAGGNIDYDFGNGWSISDKFLVSGGDMDTNALFSGNNPSTLDAYFYDASVAGGARDVGAPDADGNFPLALAPGSATATYVGGGAVPGTQSIIHQGWWYIHKHLKNVNNDFRLSKELFEGNTLTAGIYLARYEMDDKWALGNQMLMTNTPNARPITASYVSRDGSVHQLTDNQGFLDYGGYNIAQSGRATNKAFYLSDVWRVGKWLLDLSGRIENLDAKNSVCNLTNQNLDGNGQTDYDRAVPVCNGTFSTPHFDKSHPAFTAGANYTFTDNMSAYVRVNSGAHFVDFDNGIRGVSGDNFPPLQNIRNYEGGFKYQSKLVYLDISAYKRKFSGLLYTPTDANGTPDTTQQRIYGTDSKGVNFIGALTPVENLRFQLVANYLDGKYSDIQQCIPYTDINGVDQCVGIEGKQLQRQPKLRYMFTPSYNFVFGWGDIMPYVTYTHVGDHTQDLSGLQQLGSYNTWDFGVVSNVGDHWQFNVRGSNMTNELGLTESNSRIFGSAGTSDGVILARPIEGREVNFQAKYLW